MFVMQALAGQTSLNFLLFNFCRGKQPHSEPPAVAAAATVVASWLISSPAEPLVAR